MIDKAIIAVIFVSFHMYYNNLNEIWKGNSEDKNISNLFKMALAFTRATNFVTSHFILKERKLFLPLIHFPPGPHMWRTQHVSGMRVRSAETRHSLRADIYLRTIWCRAGTEGVWPARKTIWPHHVK